MRNFARACALAVLAATTTAGGPRAATVAAPAPHVNTLTIDFLECYSSGHGKLVCQYSVSGGSGTVSMHWSPTPIWGGSATGSRAIIPCTPYQNVSISLTVTDTGGGSDFEATTAICGAPL